MSSEWILAAYLLFAGLAVALLYFFGVFRWYLHLISALAALVAGLFPPLGGEGGAVFYFVTGSLFSFLFVWGAGAPIFRVFGIGREHRPAYRRHVGASASRVAPV